MLPGRNDANTARHGIEKQHDEKQHTLTDREKEEEEGKEKELECLASSSSFPHALFIHEQVSISLSSSLLLILLLLFRFINILVSHLLQIDISRPGDVAGIRQRWQPRRNF